MKLHPSVLQAAALALAGIIGVGALVAKQYGLANSALVGLFAALSIHPKPPGASQ